MYKEAKTSKCCCDPARCIMPIAVVMISRSKADLSCGHIDCLQKLCDTNLNHPQLGSYEFHNWGPLRWLSRFIRCFTIVYGTASWTWARIQWDDVDHDIMTPSHGWRKTL